jgi:hypothetical protein
VDVPANKGDSDLWCGDRVVVVVADIGLNAFLAAIVAL